MKGKLANGIKIPNTIRIIDFRSELKLDISQSMLDKSHLLADLPSPSAMEVVIALNLETKRKQIG